MFPRIENVFSLLLVSGHPIRDANLSGGQSLYFTTCFPLSGCFHVAYVLKGLSVRIKRNRRTLLLAPLGLCYPTTSHRLLFKRTLCLPIMFAAIVPQLPANVTFSDIEKVGHLLVNSAARLEKSYFESLANNV